MQDPRYSPSMDTPPLVRDRLDGESVTASVALGGDDAAFVTPTRTLVYRADGLLSDESVAAYPHDVERLSVSTGRRKASIEFEYVDTSGNFTLPSDRVDAVLAPVFGGILRAAGVMAGDESVRTVHRFSELTLVVTEARVVKHVGNALWDPDSEMYPFAEVVDLDMEEGSVAAQLVVEVGGRPQRVKIPSEKARAVYRDVEEAVLAYHGVDDVADLRDTDVEVADDEASASGSFEDENIASLVGDETEPDDGTTATGDVGAAAMEPADETPTADGATAGDDGTTDDDGTTADDAWVSAADLDKQDILTRLDALETSVQHQTELIESQRETIDQLVEELRRGR